VPSSATPYTYLCVANPDEAGTELLLVKRRLIQTWTGGRSGQPVIPEWAGQWGVVCAQPQGPEPIANTAYAAFRAQTGVALNDPTVSARYAIAATETRTLQDADYNPVSVLYVICSAEGLRVLQGDIQANIASQRVEDGVLEAVAVKRLAEAESLIRAVAPPADGWWSFVIAHCFGGNPPRLNPPIETQTRVMAERGGRQPVGFRLVVAAIPKTQPIPPQPPPPVPPPGKPVPTTVTLVNTTPARLWLSASIDSPADWGSRVNRPDVNLGKGSFDQPTLASFASLTAEEDILDSAGSARYRVRVGIDAPSDGAVDWFSFTVDQTLARTGETANGGSLDLEVHGSASGTWVVSQTGESTATGMRGLTLYLLTPHGS